MIIFNVGEEAKYMYEGYYPCHHIKYLQSFIIVMVIFPKKEVLFIDHLIYITQCRLFVSYIQRF